MEEASTFSSLALIALVVLSILIWSLPRRFAVCPLLIMTCLMPLGQQLVMAGLHFHLFRILLFVGLLRVISKGEFAQLTLTRFDKIFIWWGVVSVVFGTLSKASSELLVNRLGDAYNAFGCYFFFRCVLVDFEDVLASIRALAWLSLPVAALMMIERTTMHNLLSVFGGVPAITSIRDGHLRCQGAFRHPILAGCFGATQIPLFVALWRLKPPQRLLAAASTLAALTIVITASSSGALMALLASFMGLALWKWRRYMQAIRRGTVLTVLGLALVMNSPVWYLIAKLSVLTGGTGWHRAWLIDQAVAHLDEWWLFGTTYTAHWGPAGEVVESDPNMMDITNHYIMEGVKGGLLKLGLFLAMIVVCFRRIGWRLRADDSESPVCFMVWAAGVSLFAHCLSFISITYFDQIIVVWYWLFAFVSRADAIPSGSSPHLEAAREAWGAERGAPTALLNNERCAV